MVANTLPVDPPPKWGQNSKNMVMLHIKLKSITYAEHGANILSAGQTWGSKGQNSNFLEHGHVAYQSKLN